MMMKCKSDVLLVSFAAVIRVVNRHATLLPTNGCSRERRIPFPLFLRTNRMHVIVIGYVSGEERCVTSDDPNNGCEGD